MMTWFNFGETISFPGEGVKSAMRPLAASKTICSPSSPLPQVLPFSKFSDTEHTIGNMKLFCALAQGVGGAFAVVIDSSRTVADLKEAVKQRKSDLDTVGADQLQLYLAKLGGKWLREGDINSPAVLARCPQLTLEHSTLESVGLSSDEVRNAEVGKVEGAIPIHVLVGVAETTTTLKADLTVSGSVRQPNAGAWCIVHGPGERWAALRGEKLLSRSTLVADVLRQLDAMHVVVVRGPPMSGKSMLAALVARALVKRSATCKKKAIVFTLSAGGPVQCGHFADAFKEQCRMEWSIAALARVDTRVYFIVDEAQTLGLMYPTDRSGDGDGRFPEWAHDSHVRMFALNGQTAMDWATGWPRGASRHSTAVLGIDRLRFSRAEVSEYVRKCFNASTSDFNAPPRTEQHGGRSKTLQDLCDRLEWLTGGHAGLCVAAVQALNRARFALLASSLPSPSAEDLIRKVETGSLYQDGDGKLTKALTATCAVPSLWRRQRRQMRALERVAYGLSTSNAKHAEAVEKCVRKGILARLETNQVEFSSPVVWRQFVAASCHPLRGAAQPSRAPQSLNELLAHILKALDCPRMESLLASGTVSVPRMARVWQLELCKAAYRCLPSRFATSIDTGGLFASDDFVDIIVQEQGTSQRWGIKTLREGNVPELELWRFSADGRYAGLALTDVALVSFQRVDDLAGGMVAAMQTAAMAVCRCSKLTAVCYDARMGYVVALTTVGGDARMINVHVLHSL
jgi:hypothetical protein